MKLAVVMEPIDQIHYEKDSTLAILLEAQKRNWKLFYVEQKDLYSKDNTVWIKNRALKVFKDPTHWFEYGEAKENQFSDFDIVFMRKDPPVNTEYLYATYLLELGEHLSQGKTLVVNSPKTLRDWNEKLAILNFPACIPATIVTSAKETLRSFWQSHQEVIFKPLDAMGGRSVFYIGKEEPNFNVITETLTQNGTRLIMAQQFIPEIKLGDKRILMIGGEPVPYALARVPVKGDIRGNLAAGGQPKGMPLSVRDKWICEQVGPVLREKGLWFVGLDVIGDFLTEINITSPTCIREIDKIYSTNIAGDLLNKLEKHKMAK